MLMHLSTWMEIEAFLQRSRTVVVPIGSNEQHGPTGLLGTDWICAQAIAIEAQRNADVLVAPTFTVGTAQHHLGFPGTISLRPSTLIAAIGDWIRSLAAHGFERIYFFNGHGGNIATIDAAFSEVYAESSLARRERGFALRLQNWWDLPGVPELIKELFPSDHGIHATPSEIAVTQWAYPDSIKVQRFAPDVAPGEAAIRDAVDYRAHYPDGRIGSNPSLATPEKGAALVNLAAKALAEDIGVGW